jgi:carbonic anhydrase
MKMKRTVGEKKALVITSLQGELDPNILLITKKKRDELIIINTFGGLISQPYGCIIRSIIMAVYYENINEIYVIGEETSHEHSVNAKDLLKIMSDSGIAEKTIETLDYIKVVEDNIETWLIGPQDIKEIIKKNIELIQKHPLMPQSINVFGFITNSEAEKFEAIK